MKGIAGVYLITNTANGRIYVGSTVDLAKRWGRHQDELRRGVHHNPALQAAWSHHGPDAFAFSVLETVMEKTKESILAAEQRWLDRYRAGKDRSTYNYLAIAGSHLGRKRSEATKLRLAAAQRGKTASAETRAKQRAAKVGRKLSPEHIAKCVPKLLAGNAKRWERDRGKPSPKRILSPAQVADFLARRAEGWKLHDLRRHFHIAYGTAQRLAAGETYVDLIQEAA